MSAHLAPIEVFLSSAPEDELLCLELEKHLSVLKREGLITTWHKGQIDAGRDKSLEVDEHLSKSSVVLLLLSSSFVASDYCYSVEMNRALARHEAGETYVVPVILRPMDDWGNMPFGKLEALPSNGVPVISWSSLDDAWASVALGIRSLLRNGRFRPAVESPVSLPSLWTIPYPRNPFFTGRSAILTSLAVSLKENQASALSWPLAISGLGGVGKTQIAIEYAYQHRQDYQTVFWIHSDTRESLIAGYMVIARLLKLSKKEATDQRTTIEAVKHWLQTHHHWLMILDNADNLTIVQEFLPVVFAGHLLLTTRAQSMGRMAKRIEVETMDQNRGTLLLLRRAGLIEPDASLDTASSSDVRIGREICEELGGLPLALDQAGAYIEEVQCSLSDYQQHYQTHGVLLLNRRGGLVTDHPEPVATTWSLSFEKVEQTSPLAADLLCLCTFLSPDAIPEEMLIRGAHHLGSLPEPLTADTFLLAQAVEVLRTYSLMRRDTQTRMLSIHRLVQAVLRDSMSHERKQQWMQRAVLVVEEGFCTANVSQWNILEQYIPHALVCATWIEREQLIMPKAAHLLCLIGSHLMDCRRYAQAEFLYQQALAICEQYSGLEHPFRATCLNNLANVYAKQERYGEAESFYKQALVILDQQGEPANPRRISSLNNFAILYMNQHHYAEAEPLLLHALDLCERYLGLEHQSTLMTMSSIARLYEDHGKYTEAETLLKQTLVIRKQHFEREHSRLASDLNNLATLYVSQKRLSGAESLLKQALVILEQHKRPAHPHTLMSLNNLADLHMMQERFAEAERLLKHTLSLCEQHLDLSHPDTVDSLTNLAFFYARRGNYEEAEPLYQRALSTYAH